MDSVVHGLTKSWTRLSNFHLALGSTLKLLLCPAAELVFTGCRIKSTFLTCHNPMEKWFIIVGVEKTTLQNDDFFFFGQLMRHPLIKLFDPSNLLKMPNNQRMVNTEFLGNFLNSCKGINFNDPLKSVVVSFQWPVTERIFKALISFAKLPDLPLHCTFIRSHWAKCTVDVASNLYCL